MVDKLLSSYPERVVTHLLGHDSANLVGKIAVADLPSGGGGSGDVTAPVDNAEMAAMPAFTLKGNNIGIAATPSDLSIVAFATKSTPTTSDWLLLSDTAASGEFKKIAWAAPGGALDADLAAIAALTGTGYARRTGADTWTLDAGTGGGSGTPGGSTLQLQYNNAGAFGGVTGSSVSAGALTLGDTLTTTKFRTSLGHTGAAGNHQIGDATGGIEFASGNVFFNNAGLTNVGFHGNYGLIVKSDLSIGITNGEADAGTSDVQLYRDAAGIFGQRTGANPQTLRVYNTYTSGSVYERGVIDWTTAANTLTIGAQTLGGTLRPLNLVGSALTFNGAPITGSGGGATISDTPPAIPAPGGFWWESDTGALHISYGGSWIAVTPVPAALTRTNDTNVTLTLGGTPGTALQQPVSLTLGWTGTLSTARGGTGNNIYVVGDLLYASSTTILSPLAAGAFGTFLTSAGTSLPPAWTSIPSLTTKATPTTADWLLLSDTAAAGELKKIAWTAGGGGGSPGGSATEIQYRSGASTFGAMAGTAWDDTNRSLTMAGAAGGVATSNPVLNLTQTWNAGGVTFTGLKLDITNTASAAASRLLDLLMGGVSQFYVRKDGGLVLSGLSSSGLYNQPGGAFGSFLSDGGYGFIYGNTLGSTRIQISAQGAFSAGVVAGSDGVLGFGSIPTIGTWDTLLSRSAAGVLAIGTSAVATDGVIAAKVKAGAPVAADVANGAWIVIRDTTNSTTKLYYNNGGTLMSVALA